jgi:putative alpha-1,2-mannosidase
METETRPYFACSIQVKSETFHLFDLLTSLTGLYYTGLLPSNRTGENPKSQSNEPSYDDFYTIWDIFRCLTPWYHLVQTPRYVEVLRSMVDILFVFLIRRNL